MRGRRLSSAVMVTNVFDPMTTSRSGEPSILIFENSPTSRISVPGVPEPRTFTVDMDLSHCASFCPEGPEAPSIGKPGSGNKIPNNTAKAAATVIATKQKRRLGCSGGKTQLVLMSTGTITAVASARLTTFQIGANGALL